MSEKISAFVVQYQHSEGLRMSIHYAAAILIKERREVEAEIALVTPLATQHAACAEMLASLNADLQRVAQAEIILATIASRP